LVGEDPAPARALKRFHFTILESKSRQRNGTRRRPPSHPHATDFGTQPRPAATAAARAVQYTVNLTPLAVLP